MRDIFAPQQAAKIQNRRNQWTCRFCGKSFFEEKHLDSHFDLRHNSAINSAEDSICLSNYCDIMRCKVLLAKDSFGDATISTDIEVWSEATAYRTAISTSGPRELAKIQSRHFLPNLLQSKSNKDACNNGAQCSETADQINDNDASKDENNGTDHILTIKY